MFHITGNIGPLGCTRLVTGGALMSSGGISPKIKLGQSLVDPGSRVIKSNKRSAIADYIGTETNWIGEVGPSTPLIICSYSVGT